jgi:hypothetical protein
VSSKPKASREARGYGYAHRIRRRYLEPVVAGGNAVCVRCHRPIVSGENWHLDHTEDRRGYLGAAHVRCNLQAAAIKTNQIKARRREQRVFWSREW